MKRLTKVKCIRWLFLSCAFPLLTAAALAAPPQNTTGTISGNVQDPSGGVVAKATVVLTSETTNDVKVDTTDPQGHFSLTDLPVGQYSLDVSAIGFAAETRRDVQLAAGQTVDLSIALKIMGQSEVVTVEAVDSGSEAAHLAPMDALLDEHSARTEIKPLFIKNFTAPTADFGELVEMAPGTFSISSNGVGLAQDKTYFRGFPDGDYDIDFDGVPFYDTNTPTHHTWAFFPSPWVGGVDFDRSPGSVSTIGPTPFGGSIHLLSPEMLNAPFIQGNISYGSFNTILLDGHFDSGPFTGKKSNLSADVQHMTSDGYQTYNYQTRNAGSLKYVYKFSDNNVLTGYSGVVRLESNTPNNNPTRNQLATYGDNFLSTGDCTSVATCTDPLYYKFYTYSVPTDFEYVDWSKQFGGSWQLDFKPYTLSYYNAQYYDNPSYNANGLTFAVAGGAGGIPGIGLVSAVDKLNSYRKYGDNLTVSQVSRYGILRTGLWYEWAATNRFQIPSDPLTHVDANLPNFHEQFWTNSAQPFVEYEWRATQKLSITGGFKYAYFNQNLQQYQDNGKTVGCLGGTLVGNPKTTPNDSCTGGLPFATHDAGYSSYLPSADANYRILPIWSVYGQYATGTIVPPSGVFDVTGGGVQTTPKPTGATTFQGGTVVKLKMVTLNADYYHTHFTNTYTAIPDPNNPSAVDYTTGGDSVTQGFEGEATLSLTRGFSFYVNGTLGRDHYVTPGLPSDGLWVANAPTDTEAFGLTFQQKSYEVGLFEKRVGYMWNDNLVKLTVPAATGGVPGTLTFSGVNPAGKAYSLSYTNPQTLTFPITVPINQVIPIQPFNLFNLYFNYTLRNGSFWDGTKFRFSVNNLFNSHNMVGDAQNANGTQANPWLYTSANVAGPIDGRADQLLLLPGRSITVSVTIGISPKGGGR